MNFLSSLQRKDESEFKREFGEWLTKTFKYILNNVQEFVVDNFANHIMRTTIKCLVGQTSQKENTEVIGDTNEEFTSILKSFVDNFLEWAQFAG